MKKVGNPGKVVTQNEKIATYVDTETYTAAFGIAKQYDLSMSSWLRKLVCREILKEKHINENNICR